MARYGSVEIASPPSFGSTEICPPAKFNSTSRSLLRFPATSYSFTLLKATSVSGAIGAVGGGVGPAGVVAGVAGVPAGVTVPGFVPRAPVVPVGGGGGVEPAADLVPEGDPGAPGVPGGPAAGVPGVEEADAAAGSGGVTGAAGSGGGTVTGTDGAVVADAAGSGGGGVSTLRDRYHTVPTMPPMTIIAAAAATMRPAALFSFFCAGF